MQAGAIDLSDAAQWPEVEAYTPVLEETVFLQYQEHQSIVTMRGVDPAYLPHLVLDPYLVEGALELDYGDNDGAILGYGVADNLNLFVHDGLETVRVYAARRKTASAMDLTSRFTSSRILPMAIVALNPEFDYKYFYASFDFARDLLEYDDRVSYYDLTLRDDGDMESLKKRLQTTLGDGFEVKSRLELNDVLFKTTRSEKLATFLILSFIMVVATFNLIGSLSMLIMDKRTDISLLRAIGSTASQVRALFLYEGMLITGVGALGGLSLGVLIVLAQQYIGLVPLEGGLVDYYPVALSGRDLLAVVLVAGGVGMAASWLPVRVLLRDQRLQARTMS